MKPKVLFVATVLRGHMLVFHLPYLRWFREQGFEVHVCARNDTGEAVPSVPGCDRYVELPFERSPLHPGNLSVYRRLKALMDAEDYALIHCHTPVGGMLGRLCARGARKRGARVVYTAHGFHFFTGAPLKNWLLFYPVERWLARHTDLLLTINGEDYRRALRFPAKQVEKVAGVGVDLARFSNTGLPGDKQERSRIRDSLGLPEDAPLVMVVGEHIPRKNHETALRAITACPEARLAFCGVGELTEPLRKLAEALGVSSRVLFLGFRKDIPALLAASDVFLFPSLQEGLPVSLMEAMAAGLPCVASRVRGNRDLIGDGDGGTLREPLDAEGFARDITELLQNPALREDMGARNRQVVQDYGLPRVLVRMAALYREQLDKRGAR